MALSARDRRLAQFMARAIMLAILQAVLLRVLADANVVSVALGAGMYTPLRVLLPAVVYLFLRVWVVLCLPGLLAYELVCWAGAEQEPTERPARY
jgi:hypothetical protein